MRATIVGPLEALEARPLRHGGSRATPHCGVSGRLPSHGAPRAPGDSAGTGSDTPWVEPRVIVALTLSRTLVTGAVGSLLLDWYGWQSVFYVSGGLTLLWVCYVYRYLLSEQGNRGRVGARHTRSCPEGQGPVPDPPATAAPEHRQGPAQWLSGEGRARQGRQPLRLRRADGGLGGLGAGARKDGAGLVRLHANGDPQHQAQQAAPVPDSERLSRGCPLSADLILAVSVLVQGLPVARDTRVPWRQLFRKPSVW